jgi:hypothetical protein
MEEWLPKGDRRNQESDRDDRGDDPPLALRRGWVGRIRALAGAERMFVVHRAYLRLRAFDGTSRERGTRPFHGDSSRRDQQRSDEVRR